MIGILPGGMAFSCAILLSTFFNRSVATAQNGTSTGRFCRDGVITAITSGNITVSHDDYQLSEPIRMSERGKFVAQTDGQLYLGCDDKWNQVEDNKGRLKVFVRKV